jgi:hypothetical protein
MSIFVAHPPADPHNLGEGRERQRAAAAAGGKGQFDALLDGLVADKDQVGGIRWRAKCCIASCRSVC